MRYRWFANETKETDEFGVPVSRAAYDEALQPQKISYHRGEVLAIIIAMAILLYEWFHDDSPLIYVCVAFLVFELRPIALLFFGKAGRAVSNALLGFSLATFIGVLFWILFW